MAKPKSLPYEAAESEEPYSVTLHNATGGSDKIYKLSIESSGSGWVVNYENGRRGGTMVSGTKTKAPVSYAEARKAANSVLYDKVGGGYVPIAGSRFADGMTAEAIAVVAKQSIGHLPQLLNPIGPEDAEARIRDDRFAAQRKYDGERRILVVGLDGIVGGNRKGQSVPVTEEIAIAAERIGAGAVLDGEQVGSTYFAFDLLAFAGRDLRSLPFEERQRLLCKLPLAGAAQIVPTAFGTRDKRALIEDVRAKRGEGVVFKRIDSSYAPGRPASEGDWLKFKFWKDLSAVVGAVNDKRSVVMELLNEDGTRLAVGNVTIPPNFQVPPVGAVIEVEYLYAMDGGALVQPIYRGERVDISPEECTADQRQFNMPDIPEPEEEVTRGMGM